MDNKIYIKDWLLLKPYEKHTRVDSYYLKISNDVKKVLTAHKYSSLLDEILSKKGINILSCFLTSYLEDLISETNIWNTFVRIHKRLYNKFLPFYNLDEYYEDEINPQDINFLIWYFLNTVQQTQIISPNHELIFELGEKIMDIFDEAWDKAPVNEYLNTFYQAPVDEDSYYSSRNLIDTLLFKTYLFYPDSKVELEEQESKIIEEYKGDINLVMYLNEVRDNLLHQTYTNLLSLKGKEWAAELLNNHKALSKDFLNTSKKIIGFFLYKGQDDDNIFLEHIASSKAFNLTKKSFEAAESLTEIDTMLYIGLVYWKNEWWFSGIFAPMSFDPEFVAKEKKSIESRRIVGFLDYEKNKTSEQLQDQLSKFKTFNNGSQIKFLPSKEVEAFYRKFINYYSDTLNLSEEEINESKQRAKEQGIVPDEHKSLDLSNFSETGLLFFNPKMGGEIAFNVNSAFPMPSNPYFEEADSEEHIIRLLTDPSLSPELVHYCLDNCKDKLSYFKTNIGKQYLNNLDFLLRFWKKEDYHSIPMITYV